VQEMEDQYYLLMRHGIEDCCAKNKINIIRKFKTDIDYLDALNDVDGIICIGKFSKQEISDLKDLTPNLVFLDMPVEDTDITSITLDFSQAVNTAMEYLYNLGHKKVGFLGGIETPQDNSALRDERFDIFKDFCIAHNIEYENYIGMCEFNISAGYKAMAEMIEKGDLPTAIFAASDPIAIGAMRALQDKGYNVPYDISIIGFDNIEIASYTNPSLTTMSAPVYAMGFYGVSIVNSLISDGLKALPTAMRIKLPCKLEIRNSCK
ncbi:MAG: substrate-binding domain-containing protein, partial [Ruminococcus sp.]|nr:substrate-binding domain-containing protein [Ruminococcus sp.]